jgi:hypothetical protein
VSIRKRTLAAAAAFAVAGITLAAPSALANTAYKNCNEARAAGASNIPASDPRYQPGLDRNHNGIGCEAGDPAAVVVIARVGNGRHAQPTAPGDPTTCTDGLLTLVKVRTDEHRLGVRVTVAEQDDEIAQKELRTARQDDQAALETRRIAIHNAEAAYTAGKPYHGTILPGKTPPDTQALADGRADAAAQAIRDSKIADAKNAYANGGTAAKLATAKSNAEAKRSYLAELRIKQTDEHSLVVRLTLLVDSLCQKPAPAPIPTPEPTTEPAPVDTTPPVDNTPPAPVIVNQPQTQIINNPAIGQVPTGSNTGGGSEAATVE